MSSARWYSDSASIKINELEIQYKNSGAGTSLLCIHGFPSSSWDFQPIWPSLTDKFSAIAPDLIGLGKSAKPQIPLTIRLQADMIEALLIRNGIRESHILAHNMGDTVAQELLARQLEGSNKIDWKSCVFLNGGLFPETHQALFIQKLLLSPFGKYAVHLMSENSLRKSFNNIFSKAHPPSDEFIAETWQLITENNGRSMIPKLIGYMDERKENRERWVNSLVKGVVPLRLINGIEDPVSGKHAADRYAEIVPDADIVYLENSGHYPHIETSEAVENAFFEFHEKLN